MNMRDAAAAVPDNLSNNFVTVNANGTIGALFQGGIQIPEAGNSYIPTAGLGFTTADPLASAKVPEYILGQLLGSTQHNLLLNVSPDGANNVQVVLSAQDPSAAYAGSSYLLALVEDTNPGEFRQVMIINSANQSDFVQRAAGVYGKQQSGSPACIALTANSGAWGAGVGEYLTSATRTTVFDPESRIDGTGCRYVCPNAGIYLVMMSLSRSAGTDESVALSVGNTSHVQFSGGGLLTSPAVNQDCFSTTQLIQCNSGDVMEFIAKVGAANNNEYLGPDGKYGTWAQVMQVY